MKARAFRSPEPLEARIAPAVFNVFDLGHINGRNAVRLDGAAGDAAGYAVAGIGDVNQDGFDDLFVGTPSANLGQGGGYVLFGTAAGFAKELNLDEITSNGFRLIGAPAGSNFGFSASAAGDVNGDGIDDFIVGAPGAQLGGIGAGAAYVILGRSGASAFPRNLDVSQPTAAAGFRIDGQPGDAAGVAVAAGDVNDDGYADLIVGTPGANSGTGGVGVVYGQAGASLPDVRFGSLTEGVGFLIAGGQPGSLAGTAVAAGDVNGDGKADLLIGAPGQFDPQQNRQIGATHVVFGPAEITSVSELNGTNGFRLFGSTKYQNSGNSVAAADVNGDGLADVVVGGAGRVALLPNGGVVDQGIVHVVYGRATGFPANIPLGQVPPEAGFRITSSIPLGSVIEPSFVGLTVASAGDIQGDGFEELLIGAPGANFRGESSGSAYLLFGKPQALLKNVNLNNLGRFDGARFDGEAGDSEAGFALSGVGDFNGDGFGDFVIGAPGQFTVNDDIVGGAAYLAFGTPGVPNGKRALTYTDADGEEVSVKLSQGELDPSRLKFRQQGRGAVLESIDLTGGGLEGAALTIQVDASATKARGLRGNLADGQVHIGLLDASGVNLKKLKVKGDVTSILAGAGDALKGIKTLVVDSMGLKQSEFSGLAAALQISGGIGKLKVKGNMAGITGGLGGNVDNLTIDGSLTDSDLEVAGSLKKLMVRQNLTSSDITLAAITGSPAAGGGRVLMTQFTVLGDLNKAGLKILGQLKNLKINGTVTDFLAEVGDGIGSGLTGMTVNGAMTGSTVKIVGKAKNIKINGDLTDTKIEASTTPDALHAVRGAGGPGTLVGAATIGGNLSGGELNLAGGGLNRLVVRGNVTNFQSIIDTLGGGGLGRMVIAGGLSNSSFSVGGLAAKVKVTGGMADTEMKVGGKIGTLIVAGGLENSQMRIGERIETLSVGGAVVDSLITAPGTVEKPAFGSIRMDDLRHSQILAGYDPNKNLVNPDARIGKVVVRGDYEGSDLVAGVGAGSDGMFGDANDTGGGGDPLLISSIASVVIKGAVLSTAAGADHFGIVAEQISKLKLSGVTQSLNPGPGNDDLLLVPSDDTRAREVVVF